MEPTEITEEDLAGEEEGKLETITFFSDLLTMIVEMTAGHKQQLLNHGYDPDNAELASLNVHDALIDHFL